MCDNLNPEKKGTRTLKKIPRQAVRIDTPRKYQDAADTQVSRTFVEKKSQLRKQMILRNH